MADDDAILRQTQRSIDNLFKQVSGSASAASDGLNRVASAGGQAASGIRALSSSAHNLAGSLSQVSSSALNASKGFATSAGFMNESITALINDLDSLSSASYATSKPLKELEEAQGRQLGVIEDATEGASGIGMLVGYFLKKAYFVGAMLGTLAGGLGELGAETLVELSAAMDATGEKGMQFGNDLLAFGRAANNAMLTNEEFAKALRENSVALAVFGGTAQEGANRFSDVASALNDAEKGIITNDNFTSFLESLTMMGIREEERAELLADIMSDESRMANLRKMTAEEIAVETHDYAESLSQLSVLTGKSRKELAADMKQRATDGQYLAATYKLGAEAQKAMRDGLAASKELGGKSGEDIFKAGIAGVMPTGEEAKRLFATPAGQALYQMATEMREKGDNAGAVLQGSLDGIHSAFEKTRESISGLAAAGIPGFTGLFAQVHTTTERFNGLLANANETGDGLANLNGKAISLAEAFEKAYERTMGIVHNADDTISVGTALTQATKSVETLDLMIGQAITRWGLETLDRAAAGTAITPGAADINQQLAEFGIGFEADYDPEARKRGETNNQIYRAGLEKVDNAIEETKGIFETLGEEIKNLTEAIKNLPVNAGDGAEIKKRMEEKRLLEANPHSAPYNNPPKQGAMPNDLNPALGGKASNNDNLVSSTVPFLKEQSKYLEKIAENTDRKKQLQPGPEIVIQQVAENAPHPMGLVNEQEYGNG